MTRSGEIARRSLPGAGARGMSLRRYPVVDARLSQFVVVGVDCRVCAVGSVDLPKMLSSVGVGPLSGIAVEVLKRRFQGFLLVQGFALYVVLVEGSVLARHGCGHSCRRKGEMRPGFPVIRRVVDRFVVRPLCVLNKVTKRP